MIIGTKTDLCAKREVKISEVCFIDIIYLLKKAELFATQKSIVFMEVSNEDKTNIELMYKILMIRVSTVIKTNLLQQVDDLMASKVNRISSPHIPISLSDEEYEPVVDLKDLKLGDNELFKEDLLLKRTHLDSPIKTNEISLNEEDLKMSALSMNKTQLDTSNINDSLEATVEDSVHVDTSGKVSIRRYKTIKSPNISQQRKQKTPQPKTPPFLVHDPNVRRNTTNLTLKLKKPRLLSISPPKSIKSTDNVKNEKEIESSGYLVPVIETSINTPSPKSVIRKRIKPPPAVYLDISIGDGRVSNLIFV